MLKKMHSVDRAIFMAIWLFMHGWERNLDGIHMTSAITNVLETLWPNPSAKVEWVAQQVHLNTILTSEVGGRLLLHPDLVVELDAAMLRAWEAANE